MRLAVRMLALALACAAVATPARAQSLDGTTLQQFSFPFNVDYFVHVASRQNFSFEDDGFDDTETFLWERLRPKVSGTSLGSKYVVRKEWLDVLNAYVDVNGPAGLSFRVGRRQADFDAILRLVRTPDFAAVVRSFDLAEVRWQRKGTEARAFAFRTVENLPDRFNTWKRGEQLWSVFLQQELRYVRTRETAAPATA